MRKPPYSGTFFIIRHCLVVCLDSPSKRALDHVHLFPRLVDQIFPSLDPETREELKTISVYSLPRGRCVARGELDPFTHEYRRASITLFCDPACKPFESRLLKVFGLDDLQSDRFSVTVDYSDDHYQVQRYGIGLMELVIKENREIVKNLPDTIRIPGTPRRQRDIQLLVEQADAAAIHFQLSPETRRVLSSLSPRELEVLRQRFGIDEESKTPEPIGDDFFVSRERLAKIKQKALQRFTLKREADERASYLKARYPELLKDARIECGEGWMKVIVMLLSKFSRIRRNTGVDLQVVQIKEKFGGLRVYYEPSEIPMVDGWVWHAKRLCAKTCEVCGAPGLLRDYPHELSLPIKTLCDLHHEQTYRDRILQRWSAGDPSLGKAVELCNEHHQLSVAFVMKHLRVRYGRAVKIVETIKARNLCTGLEES